MSDTTYVPDSIRNMVAVAASRTRPASPSQVAAAPPPLVEPEDPVMVERSRVPIIVRVVGLTTRMVYVCAMRLALLFRSTADNTRAFQQRFAYRYWQASQFIEAHRHGFVTTHKRNARRATCSNCRFNRTINDHARCTAMGCGCSMKRRWVFTYLSWLQWLAGWSCRQGKWGSNNG